VRLAVYDVAGRTVRVLVDGTRGAGEQQAAWDGKDERGARAGAGVYVTKLEADGTTLSRKISLLK